MKSIDESTKLLLIKILLWGFASGRVVGYIVDGRNDVGADGIFIVEVIGGACAHLLRGR